MDRLIFYFADALHRSAAIAIVAALVWGIASVFASPCHLGTIPLIVAYVGTGTGASRASRTHAAALSFSFAGGMLVAIAALGALVASAGFAVARWSGYTNWLIAVVFVAAGLSLLGLLPLPTKGFAITGSTRKGRGAAAVLGMMFGVGLSPCTFAFLAPMLALSFGSTAVRPVLGMTCLLVFAVAHCGVIGLAGTFAGAVQRYLDWNERSRGLSVLKGVCGVLLLGSAAVLVYSVA